MRGTIDVDPKIPDLFAQRVAVKAEKLGRLDLVAPGRGHRRQHQRIFDLGENALVKAGRRQIAAETGEIALKMMFDGLCDGHVVRQRGGTSCGGADWLKGRGVTVVGASEAREPLGDVPVGRSKAVVALSVAAGPL